MRRRWIRHGTVVSMCRGIQELNTARTEIEKEDTCDGNSDSLVTIQSPALGALNRKEYCRVPVVRHSFQALKSSPFCPKVTFLTRHTLTSQSSQCTTNPQPRFEHFALLINPNPSATISSSQRSLNNKAKMCGELKTKFACGHSVYTKTQCPLYLNLKRGQTSIEQCPEFKRYEQEAAGSCHKWGRCGNSKSDYNPRKWEVAQVHKLHLQSSIHRCHSCPPSRRQFEH